VLVIVVVPVLTQPRDTLPARCERQEYRVDAIEGID
jgi:hypothetical protein